LIDTVLGDRYRILGKIGGGGMAEVYKAFDSILQKDVAVKLLRQQYVHDDDFVERFRREAYAASSLSHDNVVAIYDVGEKDDIYYIVMEYIEGYTLKEMIQTQGAIPIKKSLDIAKKIASALGHAHQHHIVHRDIKPHNILIGHNGDVKVTDFGIARAISQATITHTGSVLGSVHYLSPEQARGGWTDEKTDLYSLGIVIYEMVTGELPFSGDSPITVALKHLQEDFIYPSELNRDIPQSVENIIIKALMKDPTKRYASAEEMRLDIETALDSNRLNEKRIQKDDNELDDEQATMILPSFIEGHEKEQTYSSQSRKKKSEKSNKNIIAKLLVTLIIVIISFFLYQFISAKLVIPESPIPNLEGKTEDVARETLKEMNLNYEKVEVYDKEKEKGVVVRQQPEFYPGSTMKTNQVLTLYISRGKETISMPDISDKQVGPVKDLLIRKGFKEENIIITEVYHDEIPPGQVFDQFPSANEKVVPDERTIKLYVSKGKQNVEMPNLIGLTEVEAESMLIKDNLELGEKNEGYSLQPKGQIYRQSPYDPGFSVAAGAKVDIWVSLGYYPEAQIKLDEEIIYLGEDENEARIKIVIQDAREQELIWKDEVITETTQYTNIPLILMPNKDGSVMIYKNDKLIRIKTISY